ncbi:MAG: EamA family transporter [Bacillaceae bacterium]|nr:EamA family transporter [Bacillaceae bacterium]
MKQNVIGALCLASAASIWGGMYVVSKYVLEYIPPFTLVWLRYLTAYAVLLVILKSLKSKKQERTPATKADWLLIGWIGFIGYFVSISLQFIGTKLSDAHTGALITSATPAFIVIFARIVLKEPLTFRKIVSLILATTVVVTVIGWDMSVATHVTGSVILIVAALTWALLSVYVKVASKRFSSISITTYAILFALIFTTPLMLWELQTHDIYLQNNLVLPGILYLGIVSTAGAFFLWNKGLELMDAGSGSLFFFFQPVTGSFLGWLLLNEALDVNFFVGGFLVLAGVLAVTFDKEIDSN